MIRPSIAPIKPKTLKQSDLSFDDPFNPTSTRQYTFITTRSPKTSSNQQQVSSNNSSLPISVQLDTQRTNRIFQRQGREEKGSESRIYVRLREHMELMFEGLRRENKKDIRGIKSEMEKLSSGVALLNDKFQGLNEKGLKSLITEVVMNLTDKNKIVSERENIKMQSRFQIVDEKLLKIQQYYIQNMQKAYMEVKQITVCMQTISNKLQFIQQQNISKISSIQQRLKSLQTNKTILHSISNNLHLSKINLQQPQSIVSKYQFGSQMKESVGNNNNNKQNSLIRKFDNVIDASSQMIMIGDEGDITDIKGLPIVDGAGNMVVVNLKQIRKILSQGGERRGE